MAKNGTKNGQKRVEAEQSSYYREYPAAFGQKREIVARVLANQIRPTTLSAAIAFRYIRFRPKKHRVLPFLAIAHFLSTEHEGLSTHVQREWSAEPFMPSILSLRIFCTAVLSRSKFSPPTVCVLCCLPVHSGHQVRWPYQPGSHRRKVTQDLSSTFVMMTGRQFHNR